MTPRQFLRQVLARKRHLEAEVEREKRWNERIAWVNATLWNTAGRTLPGSRMIKPGELLGERQATLSKEEEEAFWALHHARLQRERAQA